ncbi:MAG TPA: VOC family protein [Terriglobales bacterium]|nr:VOC family protein [Terriglobales bacterium]
MISIQTSIPLSWSPQGTFHHVGIVVASIEKSIRGFSDSTESEWDGVVTHDPNQGVRVTFLRSTEAANPLIELVEPAGEDSPVVPFLKKGGGLHHLCYEAENLENQLEFVRSKGGLITRQPLPAAAFGGRRIAWVYTKNKLLIEYLER